MINEMKSFIAQKSGKLTKLALANVEDLSYSVLLKSIRKKDVKVNGKRVGEDVTLNVGDVVEVYFTVKKQEKYKFIYQDENVVIVYKKSGYLSEAVFDDLLQSFPSAKFIHRLDRNTDGIMVFALNDDSESLLLKGFKERTIDKKYHAWVVGVPKTKQAILTAYLQKDKDASQVKIFSQKVKDSVEIKTGYKVIKEERDRALLEVTLYTGKTHQIRAHLSFIGYPIIGDSKYGDFEFNKKHNLSRQMLTATEITFHFDKQSKLGYLDNKTFCIEK